MSPPIPGPTKKTEYFTVMDALDIGGRDQAFVRSLTNSPLEDTDAEDDDYDPDPDDDDASPHLTVIRAYTIPGQGPARTALTDDRAESDNLIRRSVLPVDNVPDKGDAHASEDLEACPELRRWARAAVGPRTTDPWWPMDE